MKRTLMSMTLTLAAAATLAVPFAAKAQTADDDKQFLVKANQADVNEIKISQLAEQKASDPRVKAFATKMVKEHTALETAMKPYAEKWMVQGAPDLDDSHKSKYEKLSGLSGKDFDKEYMDAMVSDHDDAESLFKKEIKDTKDMKFRKAVEGGYSHVTAHYNMAKSLKKSL